MYTDYAFYVGTYFGDKISEKEFPKWEKRASDKLNDITNGQITGEAMLEYTIAIQEATCTLADRLYELERFTTQANSRGIDGMVQSRSSGGESVTFANITTEMSLAIADSKARDKMLYEAVRPFLRGTGLLYQGV